MEMHNSLDIFLAIKLTIPQIKTRCKGLKEEVPKMLAGEHCLVDNRSESGIERASGPNKRSSK